MGSAAEREAACCRAEPECVLCPLRSENAERSLAQLKAAGLNVVSRCL